MKIGDILMKDSILLHLRGRVKRDVLAEMAGALANSTPGVDETRLFEALSARERLRSTGIEEGAAIPHCRFPDLSHPVISFARSLEGVDFDSSDKQPTHLFFLLAVPNYHNGYHLRALARISRYLRDACFRKRLSEAETKEDVCRAVDHEDAKF